MKKKYTVIVIILFITLFIATGCLLVAEAEQLGAEQRQCNNLINSREERVIENENYTGGVLSTGARYEFRGDFNFNEFRVNCNFFLERPTNLTVIADTYTDAAELGQFYIFPTLIHMSESMERNWIIVVYYCTETDNWVIMTEFAEGSVTLGEPTIFAINRTTGDLVEFSRNAGSSYMYRPERAGWERTLDTP